MRFEEKHRVFKQWARTSSYKNLCWSLATKYQHQSAYLVQVPLPEALKFSSGTILLVLVIIYLYNNYNHRNPS